MSSDPSASTAPAAGDIAIRVRDVSKRYVLFDRPEDRFKQMVVPRLERLVGRPPRRYYRDFAALSGVSFEIGRGETVGVVGRNGSGKSTLLQIVCGTLQPTAGSVEVNGRIAALLELGAGFNPEFTGRENVMLNASILGVPRREMEWRFDDIARFADIGPFLDQPVKTYSSGMYMRLAFATAVNVDPDILVVDEALAVGDEAFQRKCFARIEDIKDKGGTILFVSHGAQTIVQLCTRAMLIDAGELILQGRPKMVTGQYQRLINASEEGAAEIRAGITDMRNQAIAKGEERAAIPIHAKISLTAKQETHSETALPVQASSSAPMSATFHEDGFDEGLRTQSLVVFEPRGAEIHDVRIKALDGRRVNLLRLGRRYSFEYAVKFDAPIKNLGFGMQLRTVQGVMIAGSNTSNVASMRLRRAETGSTIQVRFGFNCLLLPGSYFVSCGCRGAIDGEELLLHRIVDGLAIRVLPEEDLIATGRADLGIDCATEFKTSAALDG